MTTTLISHVIGADAATRIAAEIGVDAARITLGDDIGPSDADAAEHRWPLFVDGVPRTLDSWVWDTAIGYELAEADTIYG